MSTLLTLGVSNLMVALVLACLAWSAGRWLRRPALTHGLWLLVFLKLVTPPLVSVPVIRFAPSTSEGSPAIAVAHVPSMAHIEPNPAPAPAWVQLEHGTADPLVPFHGDPALAPPEIPARLAPDLPLNQQDVNDERGMAAMPTSRVALGWGWLPTLLGAMWILGAVVWWLVAAIRLVRFHRLLRHGGRAPDDLRSLAKSVARRMQVRCPRLVLVPGTLSPMLWVFGRMPRLVLPASLIERLTPEQWRTLLAHELAHWRRRDHWVRWLELAALGMYWWCPLVWWARRELHEAEEECCDAWVVTTLPGAARTYALALIETVDFLSGARAVLPPSASGVGHVHFLQRRVTMILRERTPRGLTLTGLCALVTLGLVLLPLAPTWAQDAPPARPSAQNEEKAPRTRPGKADPENADPAQARQEAQRLQEEFAKLQRQMQERRQELEQKLNDEFAQKQQELMQRIQKAMREANDARGQPPIFPPGFPGGPGAVPPRGQNIQNQFPPGGGFPPGKAPPGPDLARRINALETKLDDLIQRLDAGKTQRRAPAEAAPPRSRTPPRGLPAPRRPEGAPADPAGVPGRQPAPAPPATEPRP